MFLVLLFALPCHARRLKRGGAPLAAARVEASEGRGRVTEVGLYVTPMFGYETNYKLLPPRLAEQPESAEVEGSMALAVEGGIEIVHERPGAVRLRAELGGLARLPLAHTRLVEVVAELPAMLWMPVGSRSKLFFSNLLGYERARTPPVFLPEDLALASPGKPILYDAIHETLRPAVTFRLSSWAQLELGAYFRAKTVTFYASAEETSEDEEIKNYWFVDLGLDLSVRLWATPAFSARLRYDLATRAFPGEGNLPARLPNFLPVKSGPRVTMLRQLLGLYLRARVKDGPLSVRASYAVRSVQDNGGYYDCLDHLVGAGLAVSLPEVLDVELGAVLMVREYGRRTVLGYSSSKPTSEGDMAHQILDELNLMGYLRGELTVTEWMQLVLSYEVEVASADVVDLTQNHRVLGGVTFFR